MSCCELWVRCEELCVFFDGEPLDRLALFFVWAELFLARADALDDDLALRDLALREPFEDERPRVVAPFAFVRSLATDMFNLPKSGFARSAGLI